jgi:ribosomal-protein-alanine N-acetyltransferase
VTEYAHRMGGKEMGGPQPDLLTGRLVLRSLGSGDALQIATLAGDSRVSEYMLEIPQPYTEPLAREWIVGLAALYDAGADVVFGISLRNSGELIGVTGLMGIQKEHSRAKLGYWIGRAYWNCGYATEAVGALIDFGFRVIGLNRIYAFYMSGNPASGRVMDKCGLRHEGILRQHIRKKGHFVDITVHSILREEFLADCRYPHLSL